MAGLVGVLEAAVMPGCTWAGTERAGTVHPAALGPQLTIQVTEPSGVSRTRWPLSSGVPFPAGMVRDPAQVRVSEGTTPIAAQLRLLSRWPDGSVRWALLDWQADLEANATRRFSVQAGVPAAVAHRVRANDRGDHIEVDTGPLQFSVPKNRFAILEHVRVDATPAVAGPIVAFFGIDGKRIDAQAPTAVRITEAGPLRVRIEIRGRYARAFEYVVRIDAFADQPFVRVFHTFEQHSPDAYTSVGQIGIEVPMRFGEPVVYSAGREDGTPLAAALPESGFTLVQEDNETLRVAGTPQAGRAAGWADLHDPTHGVAVAGRFFWQEYPQGFRLQRTGLTYNLWAPEAPPAKVGMGAAKTHELVLYFHGTLPPAPARLAALAQPPAPQLDPQWIVATGALPNSIAPSPATDAFLRELVAGYRRYQRHAETEQWDDSGEVRCPDPAHERPRHGFFGMFNWGDWNFPGYHDTTKGCDAWGNLEYDTTQVLALAYAATGDRSHYNGMIAAARHFMDVDRIHYHRERGNWVGMNHPKNPLHFAFEMGGVDLGHTWTEGLLSYYYLTGDERGLEAAREIADYLVHRLRTFSMRGNPRQTGWPQIALVAVYEATGEQQYKRAAQDYARNGMTVHPPDKIGDFKMGVLAEALSYTHALTQDAAIKAWLLRYAAAVQARGSAADPRLMPALAYVGGIAGKPEYTRMAAASVARLKFGNWGKPFTIAGRLGFRILSLTAK
jgi:hypothetical protein